MITKARPASAAKSNVVGKREPHPIYRTLPMGDGCKLEGQPMLMLNFWHEKAHRALVHAAKGSAAYKFAKGAAAEIYRVAIQARPTGRLDAVVQFEILARQALSQGSTNVISADELMVLVDGLKQLNEPVEPKKDPGKFRRGGKLTRAGLLSRYQSFLVQELETVSWHLYGEHRLAFGYRMSDAAVNKRLRKDSGRNAFFEESTLPARARNVLKTLKIDTVNAGEGGR